MDAKLESIVTKMEQRHKSEMVAVKEETERRLAEQEKKLAEQEKKIKVRPVYPERKLYVPHLFDC